MSKDSIRIQGDYNQIRYNKEIHITSVLDGLQLHDADLEDAKPPKLESPPVAALLRERLLKTRMLVLGGFNFKDKPLLARHLAWQLRETLGPGDDGWKVKEWNRPNRPFDPDETIRKLDSKTIVLFTGAQPYHLGQDLRRLREAIGDHQRYAIVTTDTIPTDWGIQQGEPEEALWYQLSTKEVYGDEYLLSVLRQRLEEMKKRLPSNLLPNGLDDTSMVFLQDLTMPGLASRLETPNRIFSFVHSLCGWDGEIDRKGIENILEQLQENRHGVRAWFRQLDPRQQLLALGLSIFDGLFDDQVFAALERLVNVTWRPRNPSFAQFEYHELSAASPYFFGTERRPETTRIESRVPLYRQALIESAWELHRRCLLDTLPVLEGLLADSVTSEKNGWLPHSPERELFGSELRAGNFRHTLALALSRIGLLSLEAADPILRRLAGDPRKDLKNVVALALGNWRDEREPGPENQLFKVLHDWREESFLEETVTRAIGGKDADRFAHVRATLALTVKFAAQHKGNNKLEPRLRELFEKLIDDHHPIVRESVRDETIPLVVALHVQQLESFLRKEMILQVDLLGALAKGLATACVLQSKVALPILDRWYRESRAEKPVAASTGEPSARETTLVVVILTYGNLETAQIRDSLLPARIFGRLRTVLAEEDHPFVRRAVLWAAILQARKNFSKATSLLQDLAGEIALDERVALIRNLTEVYLEQREELEGGDEHTWIDGRCYPLWLGSTRPKTEVEEILYRWVGDVRRPVAQQLAFESLASFLATEVDRKERDLMARIQSMALFDHPGRESAAARRSSLRALPLLGFVAAYLATRRNRPFFPALRALLPELIHWWQSPGRGYSLLLLHQWRVNPDPDLRETSRLLARALEIFRYRVVLLTLTAIVLFFLFQAGVQLWTVLYQAGEQLWMRWTQ